MFLNQILFAALLAAPLFLSAENRKAEVNRTATAPVIDGKPSDPCWEKAPWYGGYTLLSRAPEKPEAGTRFRMLHDNNALYLLFEVMESAMDKIRNSAPGVRDRACGGNCVEFMIDPNHEGERLYHFGFNTNNDVYDAEHLQGGFLKNSFWNCVGLKCASSKEKDRWFMEVKIPLVELGLERTDGKARMNAARGRCSARTEYSSFTPAKATFHSVPDWAELVFKEPSFQHFIWKFRPPYETGVVPRGGKLRFEGKLHLTNQTGKVRTAWLDLELEGKKQRIMVIADHKTGKEISFSLPAVPSEDSKSLKLTLTDAATGQVMLLRQVQVSLRYTPMDVKFTNPPYRDTVFGDMKVTELTGNVTVRTEEGANSPLKLTLLDPRGKVLVTVGMKKPGSFVIPFASAMPDGNYTLKAESGKYTLTKTLRKLPLKKGQVRFDARKTAIADGKVLIPLGAFSLTDFADAAKEGCNVMVYYNAAWMKKDKMLAYLDNSWKAGVKVVLYPYPYPNMYHSPAMKQPLSKKEAEDLRNRILDLRDHPAILAWYLGDEIESIPALPLRMKQIQQVCRETDPWHPTVILNNTAAGCFTYADCGDINMPDIYPAFLKNGKTGHRMVTVYQRMDASRRINDRVQWCVPQFFSWGDYGRPGQREPDFGELRCQHWQGVCAGVTGFFWYTYNHSYSYPEMRLGLSQVFREAHALREIMENQHLRKAIETGDTDLPAASWQIGKREYIAVTNCGTAAKSFVLPARYGEYFFAGEKGSVKAEKGKIRDRLDSFGTRVYVNDRKLAGSYALTDRLPLIEREKQRLRKKGNLLAQRAVKDVKINCSEPGKETVFWHLTDGTASGVGVLFKSKNPWLIWETPAPEETGRVVISGGTFTEKLVLQYEKDGKWVTLGKPELSEKKNVAVFRFEKVRASRFRVTGMKLNTWIHEVEAYLK